MFRDVGKRVMSYRLGLDMGTNSLGWCAIQMDTEGSPAGVLDAGVRIFSPNEEAGRDPKSKASLAAKRRLARQERKQRNRFKRRQTRLMETLIQAGLMPEDAKSRKRLELLDPYWLRRESLGHRIEPFEIGRALFHLNQRRGFKSNRIVDSENEENSAMKQGVKALENQLDKEGVRTLGEFLAMRHGRDRFGKPGKEEKRQPVRFRPQAKGSKNFYDLYPTRLMIEQEIDAIWKKQKEFYPNLLTDGLLERIKRIVIEQRPLKKPVVGPCAFYPEEERAPKAHPLFQRFRILQDACQLRVRRPGKEERHLTLSEYEKIAEALSKQSSIAIGFAKLRKVAGLPDDARFNHESERKGFQTDETARILAARKSFGPKYRKIDRERQIEIVESLLDIDKEENDLCNWLRQKHDLDEVTAGHVISARLPQGYGHFGLTALRQLVEAMEQESRETHDSDTGEIYQRPLTYDEAVRSLGLHHSDLRPEKRLSRLPYYGQVLSRHVVQRPNAPVGSQEHIGCVNNPTVHIALNQLRKVVNALIAKYGAPREIVIELARELKMNKKSKDRINKANRENREKNDKYRDRLEQLGYEDTHDNRLRMRLFQELPAEARLCVYCGKSMGMATLFAAVDIDHILPHSKTLDDSFFNKVLCCRECNQRKGNRAPEAAWSGAELETICERAERLFPKKAWRFAPGAMQKFEGSGGFLARQITDTHYMSRLAKTYLEHVCGSVRASPGRLTAMLRARWGLNRLLNDHNRKDRTNHRHHAIDAFVIACTDRGLLNRIAHASGRAEALGLDRLYPNGEFPIPFEGYSDALRARIKTLVVSHRPDHGLQGQLLDKTAYGFVNEEINGKRYNLVGRQPFDSLTQSMIKRVRNPRLRKELQNLLENVKSSIEDEEQEGKPSKQQKQSKIESNFRKALVEYGKKHGIRRVRVLETKQSVREVKPGNGQRKAYETADNHRIEIYEMPDGAWEGEGISLFDANQPDFKPVWIDKNPDANLVMKVHKGDLVKADFGKGHIVYRVCGLEPSANRLKLAPHEEAGSLQKRHGALGDPFRYEQKAYSKLKDAKAQRVRVDPIGRVYSASH